MSYVLILVVIIAGLAMFFDQRRKSERTKHLKVPNQMLTEDEAPPSATGKMKVQPVLKAMREQAAAQKMREPVVDEKEEEALPDPFASGVGKRPPLK